MSARSYPNGYLKLKQGESVMAIDSVVKLGSWDSVSKLANWETLLLGERIQHEYLEWIWL